VGLWDRVLDTHALDKHLFGAYRAEYPNLRLSRSIVRPGCEAHPMYFPFSSMNFGFVRELLPAMYQMPMRPRFADRYALWRYDDIWTGYIAQSLATKRGDAFTTGAPIVDHQKAGDLDRELLGEHYGMLISPYLYGAVDRAMSDVKAASYSRMYMDLVGRMLSWIGGCGRSCGCRICIAVRCAPSGTPASPTRAGTAPHRRCATRLELPAAAPG